jgi:hypothetical protein
MDQAEVERIRRLLRDEVERAEAGLAELERHRDGLLKMLEGLGQVRVTYARVEPVVGEPNVPRGKEAIIAVLEQEPDRWFTAAEIHGVMDQRGWTPRSDTPDKALLAVRAGIHRALKEDRIEAKQVDGRTSAYRYRSTDQANASDQHSSESAPNGQAPDPPMMLSTFSPGVDSG